MQYVVSRLGTLRRLAEAAAPFPMGAMRLPGGTLFALLLFAGRRRKPA